MKNITATPLNTEHGAIEITIGQDYPANETPPRLLTTDEMAAVAGGPEIKNSTGG